MPLRAEDLALLLAVPLADDVTAQRLEDLSVEEALSHFVAWLQALQDHGVQLEADVLDDSVVHFKLVAPLRGVGVAVAVDSFDVLSAQREAISRQGTSGIDVLIVLLMTAGLSEGIVRAQFPERHPELLVVPAQWAAALLIERLEPDFLSVSSQFAASGPGYAQIETIPEEPAVAVRRSSEALSTVLLDASSDATAYAERLRTARKLGKPFGGTILLATTFLPPVTHSVDAVKRFYRERAEVPILEDLVDERYGSELNAWLEHIEAHRRVDVIDRSELRAYLHASDYHDMPLERSELVSQIDALANLLEHGNYSICLTPESVNIPFEIRGQEEIRIRSDRRNKGEPRAGRIISVSLRSKMLVDVFEREFWSLVRLTEDAFKDKQRVLDWIRTEAGV